MKTGEHCLLFLTQDKRPSPEVPGIPRYWIVGQWVGDVRTDGASAVHFNHGAPDSLRQRYEGMNQTQFMLELLPLIPPKWIRLAKPDLCGDWTGPTLGIELGNPLHTNQQTGSLELDLTWVQEECIF